MAADVLQPLYFRPLPLGSVQPRGWLLGQLRRMAAGLTGQLDQFWPDVRDSGWFGGTAESWERAPYWLDGLVPLAFALDDPALHEKVAARMGYVLEHQHPDGWLGPREMAGPGGQQKYPRYDLWGQLLMTKVLAQYGEATGSAVVRDALSRALKCLDRHLDQYPLFNWGQFRWFDGLLAIWWLVEQAPEPGLLNLATKLHAQGFDWASLFARWPYADPTPSGQWGFMHHVVNNAMAVRSLALWWRRTGDDGLRTATRQMIDALHRGHGQVMGAFSGDECLAGRQPTAGTELCAVVEYAFSLEMLLSIWGEPDFGDRLERLIFNALPATLASDHWSHQYDQQVNQIECTIRDDRPWTTNGPDASLFGLEPNFGCCTANLHQGWPKFVAHSWMAAAGHGVAAVALAPSVVRWSAGGVNARVALETDYPFGEELCFRVTVDRPVCFPLWIRVPAWAKDPTVDDSIAASQVTPGRFLRIEREWEGTRELRLRLPMPIELVRGWRDALTVVRGPLVFALPVGEQWRATGPVPYPDWPRAGNWEVLPTTPWAYALDVRSDTLDQDLAVEQRKIGSDPFSPGGAPVRIHARGRRVIEWTAANGNAGPVPPSPVTTREPDELLTLIPYGCTNLRITELPQLHREGASDASSGHEIEAKGRTL